MCIRDRLQEIISGLKNSEKHMSLKIQNELTQLLSETVENIILKNIESTQCLYVIMDTLQDINRKDQPSQIIRCVSVYEDEARRLSNLKINESFLVFIEVTNQTGLGLSLIHI